MGGYGYMSLGPGVLFRDCFCRCFWILGLWLCLQKGPLHVEG